MKWWSLVVQDEFGEIGGWRDVINPAAWFIKISDLEV
jgi:hypothetical protein